MIYRVDITLVHFLAPSVSAVWSKLFGQPVFIYLAVWIQSYGPDSIFVLNFCFKLFPKKNYLLIQSHFVLVCFYCYEPKLKGCNC